MPRAHEARPVDRYGAGAKLSDHRFCDVIPTQVSKELASLSRASWNQIAAWLQQMDVLRKHGICAT